MDEENITFDSLDDASQLNAPSESRTVESVTQGANALTLDELNAFTGKQFPNKEAALKSIKDTISFVGTRKEDIKREVLTELQTNSKTDALAKELEAMRKERFFDKNPDLAAYRAAYEKVGGSPDEFFNSEAIKPIIDKAKGYDESQKLRTVLESNPRIASSKDNLSKAKDLMDSGKFEAAGELAARAVLDAYSK